MSPEDMRSNPQAINTREATLWLRIPMRPSRATFINNRSAFVWRLINFLHKTCEAISRLQILIQNYAPTSFLRPPADFWLYSLKPPQVAPLPRVQGIWEPDFACSNHSRQLERQPSSRSGMISTWSFLDRQRKIKVSSLEFSLTTRLTGAIYR